MKKKCKSKAKVKEISIEEALQDCLAAIEKGRKTGNPMEGCMTTEEFCSQEFPDASKK